jgi:hypothetical protein
LAYLPWLLADFAAGSDVADRVADGIAERGQQFFDPRIKGCDVPLQLFDNVSGLQR